MSRASDRFRSKISAMPPPTNATLWVGGTLLLWALYTFVFSQTLRIGTGEALIGAAANVVPLSLLAGAAHAILKSQVMQRSVPVQAIDHAGLAIAFATTWYALILLMLAFSEGVQGRGFHVGTFTGPQFAWQVFQGLVLYFGIAATCYAIRGGRQAGVVTIMNAPPLDRYLTRRGDEMVPINVRDIVTITGAQDYSEVAAVDGRRHLVRMTLGEFEQRLDPAKFIRVHRSTIVNFDHLARAEPAGGGRMLAHMANGESVPVSRAGAQTLRTLTV